MHITQVCWCMLHNFAICQGCLPIVNISMSRSSSVPYLAQPPPRELELISHLLPILTDGCVTVCTVSHTRPPNLSMDHFEYTCPVRYTEIDHTTSQLCVHALGMHALVCACTPVLRYRHRQQIYSIEPSQWRFSSVPVAQQSNDDYDDETLLKKLCALLCVLQNASKCTLEHIKSQKFLGGACPQTPPTVNGCRGAMFSTSANDIAPPDGNVMYGPVHVEKTVCQTNLLLNITFFCFPVSQKYAA